MVTGVSLSQETISHQNVAQKHPSQSTFVLNHSRRSSWCVPGRVQHLPCPFTGHYSAQDSPVPCSILCPLVAPWSLWVSVLSILLEDWQGTGQALHCKESTTGVRMRGAVSSVDALQTCFVRCILFISKVKKRTCQYAGAETGITPRVPMPVSTLCKVLPLPSLLGWGAGPSCFAVPQSLYTLPPIHPHDGKGDPCHLQCTLRLLKKLEDVAGLAAHGAPAQGLYWHDLHREVAGEGRCMAWGS